MPKMYLPVPETHVPVLRNAAYSIVEEILARTGLPKDTSIEFPGITGVLPESGSKLGDRDGEVSFSQGSKLGLVEVTEEYLEGDVLTTAIHRNEHPPIFIEPALGIYIKPVYVTSEVSISFEHRSMDKVAAERWRDQLRVKLSQGRESQVHSIDYHYAIPHPFLYMLNQFHGMRERVAGYGHSLKEWLQPHFTARATTLVTQSGKQPELVIKERQVGVQGWFDFNNVPQPAQLSGETATHTVTVEYRFRYDKVVGCVIDYPLMIHNQLVPAKLRPDTSLERIERHTRVPSTSRYNFDLVSSQKEQAGSMIEGVSIPTFDDWLPKYQPGKLASVLRLMLAVGTDPYELVNLGELGEYKITDEILTFLKQESAYLTKPYESPFIVSLYDGDSFVEQSKITVDPLLNVRSTVELNPRRRYHLQLGMVRDLSKLSNAAKDRLTKQPAIVGIIVNVFFPGYISGIGKYNPYDDLLTNVPDRPAGGINLPTIGGGKYVVKDAMDKIFDQVDRHYAGNNAYHHQRMLTAGIYSIIAKKR